MQDLSTHILIIINAVVAIFCTSKELQIFVLQRHQGLEGNGSGSTCDMKVLPANDMTGLGELHYRFEVTDKTSLDLQLCHNFKA